MQPQLETPLPFTIPAYQSIADTRLIVRLQGSGNYTSIHLLNNPKSMLVCQTLKHFENNLPHFIRVSKSALINPTHVYKVINEYDKSVSLLLTDGVTVRVARRRIAGTLTRLALTS